MAKKTSTLKNPFPKTVAGALSRPFLKFMEVEASGGIVLLFCTIIALYFANSPYHEYYQQIWHTKIGLKIGSFEFLKDFAHWINDGLMVIFFFVVGLEIKREIIAGELRDPKAAMLPIIAALGGMVVPALIYYNFIPTGEALQGWGIPMATDIAFVVGFLSLLGNRVPHGLKIFVLSLAIVDDIGAVLVIAIFYSSNISLFALGMAFLGLVITYIFNLLGVRRIPIYVFLGICVWLAFFYSGVHATIAGVILGLLTPASAFIGDKALKEVVGDFWNKMLSSGEPKSKTVLEVSDIDHVISTSREAVSPLERLELSLHPWVAYLIMPLFALANAGVPIELSALTSDVSIAVCLGLFVGKPVGILLFSLIAVKLGANLPKNVSWSSMLGGGFLCGVGFTMSIFIASLALQDANLVSGKIGTLMGSVMSAIVGILILFFVLPKESKSH